MWLGLHFCLPLGLRQTRAPSITRTYPGLALPILEKLDIDTNNRHSGEGDSRRVGFGPVGETGRGLPIHSRPCDSLLASTTSLHFPFWRKAQDLKTDAALPSISM